MGSSEDVAVVATSMSGTEIRVFRASKLRESLRPNKYVESPVDMRQRVPLFPFVEGCARPLAKETQTLVENAGKEPRAHSSNGSKPPDDCTWRVIYSPHR